MEKTVCFGLIFALQTFVPSGFMKSGAYKY